MPMDIFLSSSPPRRASSLGWHPRWTKDWIPAFAGMAVILSSPNISAEPAFARLYKQQYGYPPSCNACHKDGGGTPLNPYGQQFKDAGMNAAAFDKIARNDADGDG